MDATNVTITTNSTGVCVNMSITDTDMVHSNYSYVNVYKKLELEAKESKRRKKMKADPNAS